MRRGKAIHPSTTAKAGKGKAPNAPYKRPAQGAIKPQTHLNTDR